MRKARRPVVSLSVGLAALAVAAPAGAATIQVDTDLDQFGGPFPPGQEPLCGLREAVQAANTDFGYDGCERVGTGTADTILLTGGVIYTRSRSGIDDTNINGDLDITGATKIAVAGPGNATIDGGNLDRVITVHAAGSLRGTRLVIRSGLTDGTDGGGILALGSLNLVRGSVTDNDVRGDFGCCGGGGIRASSAPVRLSRVEVSDNYVDGVGGGIETSGSELTLIKSTVEDNFAGVGGGIYAFASNTVVEASTVAGNFAVTGPLPPGAPPDLNLGGGGINVSDSAAFPGVLEITNSTISGNMTDASGGGIRVDSGSALLNATTVTLNEGGLSGRVPFINSIVSENLGGDCSHPLGKRSLVGRNTGCDQSANTVSVDPDLKPLTDNGGPTKTHALEAQSRAVGLAGAGVPPRDQRGQRRDAEPDAGAFEL